MLCPSVIGMGSWLRAPKAHPHEAEQKEKKRNKTSREERGCVEGGHGEERQRAPALWTPGRGRRKKSGTRSISSLSLPHLPLLKTSPTAKDYDSCNFLPGEERCA